MKTIISAKEEREEGHAKVRLATIRFPDLYLGGEQVAHDEQIDGSLKGRFV